MSNIEENGGYLKPGTKVRYEGCLDGVEYGVVVHCWPMENLDFYDCYVAFFGNQMPKGKPKEKPYILRYASTSLVKVDD